MEMEEVVPECYLVQLEHLISADKSDDLLASLMDDSNELLLRQFSLETIGMIGRRMNTISTGEEYPTTENWFNLVTALDYVTKLCQPKESLIALMELLEQTRSDHCYSLFIGHLKNSLIRLPQKRNQTLLWALCALYRYISRLPLPDYSDLKAEERLLVNSCPKLRRVCNCVTDTLVFIEPFVSEAKECSLKTEEARKEQIVIITSFLLKLLDFPLAFCCYYFSEEQQQSRQSLTSVFLPDTCERTERVVEMMFDLHPAIYPKILDWFVTKKLTLSSCFVDESADGYASTKLNVSELSIGVFLYQIFVGEVKFQLLPTVFSPEELLNSSLPFVNVMLMNRNPEVNCMGVALMLWLTDRLRSSDKIPKSRLADHYMQDCFLRLIQTMTFSQSQWNRTLALKCFKGLHDYFDAEGQINLVRMIFHRIDFSEDTSAWKLPHMGIKGYLIDDFRKKLAEELKPSNTSIEEKPFSANVASLLSMFTRLDESEQTDLLGSFDPIMAALNLIRYLALMQSNGTFSVSSRIWSRVNEYFLLPLERGIELSRAHHELDLKKTNEDRAALSAKGKKKTTWGGLSGKEKMSVMQSAICSLDMMASVVFRVKELLPTLLSGIESQSVSPTSC